MPTLALTFPAGDAGAAFATGDPAGRTITGLAVPLGVASGPSQDGHRYRFTEPPTNADDLVDVVLEHDDDALIGRLAEPLARNDAGMAAQARIFGTTRGNDALVEAAEGARTGFSVSAAFDAYTIAADGIRDVADWTIRHLGVVRRPAFAESAGLTISASAHTPDPKGTDTMPDTDTTTADAAAGSPPVQKLDTPDQLPSVAELAALVADHLGDADKTGQHPLAQFGDFAAYAAEFASAGEERRAALSAAFAIPDQVTTDNDGVMPPAWRSQIKMNLDARRPAIRGTGTVPLPADGMDSNWPYFKGDLDSIIAKQTAEKTALSGVKISIQKATEPINTAGTISDISYQLLMRSSPSYLAAYLQICLAAWARYTESVYETALATGGTDTTTAIDTSTAAAFKGQLFEASADVEDATGAPADLVLVDKTTWVTLGGLDGLENPTYGTQNVAGTSSAATLRINVNGLEIRRAPFLSASTMVVTNGQAAKFAESGARTATQEDVTKLGRNVAVWGMYEDAEIYFPAGVRVYSPQA